MRVRNVILVMVMNTIQLKVFNMISVLNFLKIIIHLIIIATLINTLLLLLIKKESVKFVKKDFIKIKIIFVKKLQFKIAIQIAL